MYYLIRYFLYPCMLYYVTGEDLTTWDKFNQKIAHDAVEVEAMLDENKDEKISETEFKEELEKLEAVIGLGGLY